jgi:hypothetical protein
MVRKKERLKADPKRVCEVDRAAENSCILFIMMDLYNMSELSLSSQGWMRRIG